MKYRTRSTARDLVKKDICDKEIMENKTEIESTKMKINSESDMNYKLFVRQDIDIDLTSVFKKEIIGDSDIKFVMNSGEIVEASRSLLCVTSSMVDTLVSLVPCCSSSTIMMPDFSAAALNSVLELLTSGVTAENNLDKKQVSEIKNLARELGINVRGIATSNQYYEIIDSSENNSVGSKSDKDEEVGVKNVVKDLLSSDEPSKPVSFCDPFSENNDLDTLDENLPTYNTPAEVSDEIHDDLLDVEEEASPSSFESGIKLNSTTNLDKAENPNISLLLDTRAGMDTEMDEDFEFDEEYPEEEDWDIDAEPRKEEPKVTIKEKLGKDQSALAFTKEENETASNKHGEEVAQKDEESKEEVHVKVNSLHGMIDSFLSSFKDGSVKNISQSIPVVEKSDNDKSNIAMITKDLEAESKFVKSENEEPKELCEVASETSGNEISSVTLDGSDLLDETNQILINGKYQCMFCESFYTQARGLFSHCSSEHFHDEIKVKFGSLISKGHCTLCNKKVRVSRISYHLGAIHRKVNEMMEELSLPLIPCDDRKHTSLISQDIPTEDDKDDECKEEEQNEEYIPRSSRSRSNKLETKSCENNESPLMAEETCIESKVDSKLPESKINFKNFKFPSRLKISPVEVQEAEAKPIMVKGGEKKESKGMKRVSFSIVDKEPKEKGEVLKSPKLCVEEETKSILTSKNPQGGNLKTDDKITPITLKFGKGSSIGKKEQVEIPTITLPPSTTIRFEKTLESNKKSDVDVNSVDVKKLAIQSSLKEIEDKLKKFDKNIIKQTTKQKEVEIKQDQESKVVEPADKTEKEVETDKAQEDNNDAEKEASEEKFKRDRTPLKLDKKVLVENKENEIPNEMEVETQPEVDVESKVDINEVIRETQEVNTGSRELNVGSKKENEISEKPAEVPVVIENAGLAEKESAKIETKLAIVATSNKESLASPKKVLVVSEPQVNFFNCPLCIYIVDKKITLREHLSIVHYKSMLLEMFTEKDSKCKVCKKTYSNENHLSRHIGSNHKKLKEITSVHSKVYSVDNSKIPSASETFPCLVCTKCKADSCLKCIACMEMKCNPKVTEAVCFKKRCSSPISEAEFEVMKLTVNNKPESEPFDIKVEPEVDDFKIELEPAVTSPHVDVKIESVDIKTETVDVPVESEVCNPEPVTDELKHGNETLPNEKAADGNDDIMKNSEFLHKGFMVNVKKHKVIETAENIGELVKEDNNGDCNTDQVPCVEDAKNLEERLMDTSGKKRKLEETKVKNTKRSKSTITKVVIKNVTNDENVSPNPSPVISNSKKAASSTPNVSTTTAVTEESPSPNKQPINLKVSSSTLIQLRAALKLPSVSKPDQSTVSNDLKKNITSLVKKSIDNEPKNESRETPAINVVSKPVSSISTGDDVNPVLKCFKCCTVFSSRSVLYEHYSVKHFYSHIIKTFKPQEICPIPSCNVAISKENIWVSHVGAKHNIVEGFIPKEHRISATSEVKETKSYARQQSEPVPVAPKSAVSASPVPGNPSSKTKLSEVSNSNELSRDGSYRWWQDLGGDLLKGFEKKGDEVVADKMNDKVKSKLKQLDNKL